MLKVPDNIVIYVALSPIDMRKSIDGLLMLVLEQLSINPKDGGVFLFCNRGRNKVKGLYWDKNGFVLIYKRLEQGRFIFPRDVHEDHIKIGVEELNWLLAGFHFTKMTAYPELNFKNYF